MGVQQTGGESLPLKSPTRSGDKVQFFFNLFIYLSFTPKSRWLKSIEGACRGSPLKHTRPARARWCTLREGVLTDSVNALFFFIILFKRYEAKQKFEKNVIGKVFAEDSNPNAYVCHSWPRLGLSWSCHTLIKIREAMDASCSGFPLATLHPTVGKKIRKFQKYILRDCDNWTFVWFCGLGAAHIQSVNSFRPYYECRLLCHSLAITACVPLNVPRPPLLCCCDCAQQRATSAG